MRIGIVCAMDCEAAPFIENMKITSEEIHIIRKFYCGKLLGFDTVVVAGGMGKVNAAAATQVMIDKFCVTHIIICGVAGGMDWTMKIGDTVISDDVCYHDVDDILYDDISMAGGRYFKAEGELVSAFTKAAEADGFEFNVSFGRMATGDTFVTDKGRNKIINSCHPVCVDMESAAIAHVCRINGIPFIAVRSMSDTEKDSGLGTFKENCEFASRCAYEVAESAIPFI